MNVKKWLRGLCAAVLCVAYVGTAGAAELQKVPMEKQVAILYATIHDYLVKVKVADVAEYEKGLYEYLDTDASGAAVMETIRTTGNLDADAEQALKSVLSAYTESFLKAH